MSHLIRMKESWFRNAGQSYGTVDTNKKGINIDGQGRGNDFVVRKIAETSIADKMLVTPTGLVARREYH